MITEYYLAAPFSLVNVTMPLKGVKVVELAWHTPARFCGMILADFGASVLRIEKVAALQAGAPPLPVLKTAATPLDVLGNGKRSMALNLKHPEGAKILRSLCQESDVLIESFRAGVMEKLGVGPDVLLKDNPKLLYARLTGYGQSGPFSRRAGHDINYLGLSGLLSLFGRGDEKPGFPANLAADFAGGTLMCTLGILLALLERNSSGLGQVIDANMVEGTSYLGSWLYRSQSLPYWGNERGKNVIDAGRHFYEVYETKDGKFLTVGAIEPEFYAKLLNGLGLSDEEAPQNGDFEQLKRLFEAKFKEKTGDEWCEIFHDDACVAPVLSLEEAPKHRHNFERRSFNEFGGKIVPKPAPVLSRTPGKSSSSRSAPHAGEHTLDVLRDLGYSNEKISSLLNEGVVEADNNTIM